MTKTTLILCAFAAIGLVSAPASATPGDSSLVAGTWSGDSFDATFGIPGELSGSFEVRSGSTFQGLLDAVYPILGPLVPPQHCRIISGHIDDTGAILMAGTCKYEGYPPGEGFVMEAQLSEDGDVIEGVWHGAHDSEGYFTLTRE